MMTWPFFPWLLFFFSQCRAAPKNAAMDRLDLANSFQQEAIGNPLHFGQDELKLLQNYLKSTDSLDRDPDEMMQDQVLMYLFVMYDYDKSSQLDGLELMKLLTDVVSHNSNRPPSSDAVSPIVDEVLEKQDLNHDGLLDPSELLTPPSNATVPPSDGQEQEEGAPSIVLQPPHGTHQKEDNESSFKPVDHGLPANEVGTAPDQQEAEEPVNVEDNANGLQNPHLIEHEEPAAEEEHPEDHENIEYEEEEAEMKVDVNAEPYHGGVLSDHEM
ncbi:cell growth regulator with EF hand domain protein 1 [Ambystoma mexicanum]|uniref:cell growth regulator with EF hand domain protein 1 n=1 Tax=Ambystoma mexicanum TaxID=8296 RepID=UPI0037E74464